MTSRTSGKLSNDTDGFVTSRLNVLTILLFKLSQLTFYNCLHVATVLAQYLYRSLPGYKNIDYTLYVNQKLIHDEW